MIKKVIVICAMLLAAVLFASCSGNGNNATPDEATENEPTTAQKIVEIETPYGNLCVPEDFDKALKPVVSKENPYILDFVSKDDNTKILSIHFNDKTQNILGTLKADGKNVVLYAEFPSIDKNNSRYQEYSRYQMDVNTIINHLEQDYDFVTNDSIDTDDETYDIKTTLVTLKYPKKWENKVIVKQEGDCVKFSADNTPLFDLYYKEINGVQLGTYNNTPIYIVEHNVKKSEHKQMVQDVNVIIDNLSKDENFVKR